MSDRKMSVTTGFTVTFYPSFFLFFSVTTIEDLTILKVPLPAR